VGIGCCVRPSFVHCCFCRFCLSATPPNTVGFQRLARQLTSLPRSPKTSLIAHANTSSAPDGLGFSLKINFFPLLSGLLFDVQYHIVFSLIRILSVGLRAKNDFGLKAIRTIFTNFTYPCHLAFGNNDDGASGWDVRKRSSIASEPIKYGFNAGHLG